MLPLRYTRQWRAASLILLLGVLAATLMPAVWFWSDRQVLVSWFVGVDKWLHAGTFLFLAIWFSGQYARGSYWRIGIGLILFGALIEICQRMVTYRSAEWFDIVADVGGVAIGLLIATFGLGGWSQWVEEWIAARKSGAGVD